MVPPIQGGRNVQRHVKSIVRRGGRVSQIKSTSITALDVQPVLCSKGNVKDITDPLNPISIAGTRRSR
jgi:hypothetical protein